MSDETQPGTGKKLWLTYAWKDNEDEQVDFVVGTLAQRGLIVGVDRTRIVPGQRLWAQIDREITDPSRSDAWAIYATETSLRSEACQEELAIALDRALGSRGVTFPIIGIFPQAMDRALIPSAIATRLFVDLRDKEWAARVLAGVNGVAPEADAKTVAPYHLHATGDEKQLIIELRPRAGRWYPFVVLVPAAQRHRLKNVGFGPSGRPPDACVVLGVSDVEAGSQYKGIQIGNPIDALNSAYVYFDGTPTEIVFGERDQTMYRVVPPGLQAGA